MDEGLIECGKAHKWFTDYSASELVMVYKGRYHDLAKCLSHFYFLFFFFSFSFFILDLLLQE